MCYFTTFDDILIYLATLEEHIANVRLDLGCPLDNHLYVKAEKCQLHQAAVSFLGYRISQLGVVMEERKVDAIRPWPVPTTIKGFWGSPSSTAASLGTSAPSPLPSPLSLKVVSMNWCRVLLPIRPSAY
jgi:hypothetical protein